MSSTSLRYIPADPDFVPTAEDRDRAVARALERFPRAREVELRVTPRVQLVDCGESFEQVRCPACGEDLEIDSWQDGMSAAFDGDGFGDLAWTTPCCGAETSLNALDYSWPMGFARACLEIADPSEEPPGELQRELEALLRCELRLIEARL
ncbi:MAG: hypothetical protein R3B82_26305 [Sandaracinaceae bacterium]